jgi:hypothetical protein
MLKEPVVDILSKTLDMNISRMLYCGLSYHLMSFGFVLWGQSMKELTR